MLLPAINKVVFAAKRKTTCYCKLYQSLTCGGNGDYMIVFVQKTQR